MEDNEEMGKDAQDGVGNDIMMNDAEVEKEEFSLLDETLVGNKDLSQSMGTKAGNEESPQFEAAKVENKESVLHDNNQNPVATAECIEFPGKGCSPEEQGLAEPSTVISSQTRMNSCISTNKGNNDIADGTQLGALVQFDAIMSSNRSLETQTEDEMEQELENGVTVMEMDPDVSTQEEELKKGEAWAEYIQDNKIKNEASNNEVGVLELPQQHEMKNGELNVVVSEIALPPDTEEKDEVLDDILTVTGLSPDNEIDVNNDVAGTEVKANKNEVKKESPNLELDVRGAVEVRNSNNLLLLESSATGGEELGTEEEQATFMKELETFHKEKCLEFKPPRFYGEPLNCLKLWRAVIRLGGYEQVTSCKLWRQVGESFNPPKTCTTVSWTFRCFYEKALLEYEKHKMRTGELPFTDVSLTEPASVSHQVGLHQASGSGRARRDAAARAMQGWHSQRLLGNGEVGDPIIKDKNSLSTSKREKQLKSIGLLKRKKPSSVERAVKAARLKASKPQSDTMVVDIGPPADWVKINVQRTKDCFELYALVPGLLREEVRVQSDPAGRLVISGQPEQLANPWGVTPFKKVVSLPSRIDPHQTSAVVTLHGQLFVRVPFEPSDV